MTEETAHADVNPRVLVVEDEEIVRDILLKVLTEEGYRVDAVETGEEGLKALDNQLYDLVLLDLNLPKKDGREVLGEIKAHQDLRHIPVLVLTTSSNEKDVSQAYGLHANCYILKPVDIDECLNIFQHLKSFWCERAALPDR